MPFQGQKLMPRYIISGFVNKRRLNSMSSERLLFSDALLSSYMNIQNSNFADLTYISSESNLDTVREDNHLVESIWNILAEPQGKSGLRCFSFVLGYTCVEIGKIIKLLQSTDDQYVIVCKESYQKIISRVLIEFRLNGRVTFEIIKVGLIAEARYVFYHRYCMFYGKYNYVFYSFVVISFK